MSRPTAPESGYDRLRERVERIDFGWLGLYLVCGLLAGLVLSPLLWLFWEAFQVDTGRALELTLRNETAWILARSLGLMGAVTLLSILLGVPLAVLTTRTDLPVRRFWTLVVALPLVIPSYIGAFAFVGAFGPNGEFTELLGVSVPEIDGFLGATLIVTLYTYPYVFLTTRAGLLSMDGSLADAARTLNASRAEAFRRVTLPQVRPAIAAGALLAGLYAISDFGTPAFMNLRVFTSAIYWEFPDGLEFAALLSLQLIAVVAIILVIEAGIGRDRDVESTSADGGTIRLGYWRWPAMGLLAGLGFVTLVVPVVIFAIWVDAGQLQALVPGVEYGGDVAAESLLFDWSFVYNSVRFAAAAALVASLFALPIAYLSARSDSRLARLFERVTYVGFAVPGVVIGLALVFLGIQTVRTGWVPSTYREGLGGIALLVFAYVVRFLPQAVGTTRASVLQVDERHIEAARTLDAGRLEAFRRVTLPLITPGLVAGAVLVFLTTMKELPITLLLRPFEADTLVVIVWAAHEEVNFQFAAIPAFMLVVISGLTMLVLFRQEGGRVG